MILFFLSFFTERKAGGNDDRMYHRDNSKENLPISMSAPDTDDNNLLHFFDDPALHI
jgi:hypothetical protein